MRRVGFLALLVLPAGCGGDPGTVTVGAAASLTGALESCLTGAHARGTFGGSDDIAAQIRNGVDIDVFASANMALPEELARDGLAQDPVVFATNELVLAVPTGSDVDALADLEGRKLVVGSESVPVGAYARKAIAELPAPLREIVEGAIRSEEPDVKSIVGKLTTGAADAGLVYVTDVTAAGDALRALHILPGPPVQYGISVVDDGGNADEVVEDILDGDCADALRAAGFGAP